MHRTEGDGFNVISGRNVYDDTDGVRPATQLRHQEMNAIQEEIAAVIESTGASLNASSETILQMNQLNAAINNKILTETTARLLADTILQNQLNLVNPLQNRIFLTGGIDALFTLQPKASGNTFPVNLDSFRSAHTHTCVVPNNSRLVLHRANCNISSTGTGTARLFVAVIDPSVGYNAGYTSPSRFIDERGPLMELYRNTSGATQTRWLSVVIWNDDAVNTVSPSFPSFYIEVDEEVLS